MGSDQLPSLTPSTPAPSGVKRSQASLTPPPPAGSRLPNPPTTMPAGSRLPNPPPPAGSRIPHPHQKRGQASLTRPPPRGLGSLTPHHQRGLVSLRLLSWVLLFSSQAHKYLQPNSTLLQLRDLEIRGGGAITPPNPKIRFGFNCDS